MFDDISVKEAMLTIGYVQRSKCVYEASWGSEYVEHFVYFSEDSRRYLVGKFGLRNPLAEEFCIDSFIKYGHPNVQLVRQYRDPRTACSMSFEFDRIGGISRGPWPRIYIPDAASSELAAFITKFIKQHIFPISKEIIDLQTFLAFLAADVEPTPWFASGPAIRAAQIIAIASQLGLGGDEIREFLRPHDRQITVSLFETRLDPRSCVDRYLDQLVLAWTQRIIAPTL
jgi:hypothetical protein